MGYIIVARPVQSEDEWTPLVTLDGEVMVYEHPFEANYQVEKSREKSPGFEYKRVKSSREVTAEIDDLEMWAVLADQFISLLNLDANDNETYSHYSDVLFKIDQPEIYAAICECKQLENAEQHEQAWEKVRSWDSGLYDYDD